MIKLHHYSKEKFTAFDADKQIKAIVEMLSALEKNINDREYANGLITEILACYNWLNPVLQKDLCALSKLNHNQSSHNMLRLIVPIVNQYPHKQVEPDILRFDGLKQTEQNLAAPYPITVILDNLRSAYNVGSIFRTAECVQAEKLFLCGITPYPPNPKLNKTAMQTIDRLKWQYLNETEEAIAYLKNKNIPVIALETTANATNIFDYKVTQPIGLILGNEALGIEEHILKQADIVLSIPVLGWKNSLNVCNAFAIAAYYLSGISETVERFLP